VAPVVLLYYDTGILYYIMTQVFCTILWHRYYVLYYDTGIVYYITIPVFCNILWHRYFEIYYETCIFVLYHDTDILDHIMTPVFCNILWDMYFRIILWHRYLYYIMTQVFRLYSLLHSYNDYPHYQVCLAHYDICLTMLSFWDLNFTFNTL
jgi:hypothetical protein